MYTNDYLDLIAEIEYKTSQSVSCKDKLILRVDRIDILSSKNDPKPMK